MTVETNHLCPSEIYLVPLSSPASTQQFSRALLREPEKANFGDDGDFALVVNPPPPRWPRIFPSL